MARAKRTRAKAAPAAAQPGATPKPRPETIGDLRRQLTDSAVHMSYLYEKRQEDVAREALVDELLGAQLHQISVMRRILRLNNSHGLPRLPGSPPVDDDCPF